jgi:predicted HAD superfamily Cof-like phosphohydrolase
MRGFDVEGAWAEVARSNLAKIDPVTGKVNKRSDGKVLKPEGWTPPKLGDYVSKA